MEVFSFAEIKDMLNLQNMMVLIFSEGQNSQELKVVIEEASADSLLVSGDNEELLRKVPLGPTMLAIFYGKKGIMGFHLSCEGISRKDGCLRLMLKPTESGWHIERRQYPRMNVHQSILCDAVMVEGDHFEPMRHIQESFLVNICKTGVAMQANEHVEVGDYIYILFNLEEKVEADNLCVVVWGGHNPIDNDDFLYTYGLRFVNTSSRILDMIEDFVVQRLFDKVS